MNTEYEVRVLDVDFDSIMQRAESIGAVKKGVYYQRRIVYDFIPAQKGRWIRLRSNGKESTLTIKEIKSLRIDGVKELEVVVSDFDSTNEILGKLGYLPRTYQENFRVEYMLDGVNLDMDKWPGIPPYLEIEGQSENAVVEMLERMGLNFKDVTTMDVDLVYNNYGIILDEIRNLTFSEEERSFIGKYKMEG